MKLNFESLDYYFKNPFHDMKNLTEQEQIPYNEIIRLGFEVETDSDKVYFDEYGFDYCIITKHLTKKIYLDWAKETRLCEMVRLNNTRDNNIMARMPIKNLEHLEEIISFFCDEKQPKTTNSFA